MTHPPASPVDELIAAAEPTGPRPVRELLDRLDRAGLLVATGGVDELTSATGLTEDSQHAVGGRLFVAIRGFHVDGHAYVGAAGAAGAAAALVEEPAAGPALPQIVVTDTRAALAEAAGWWYGDPSRQLGVVGITGTDGKTTTSFLAASALEAAGISTGMVGTVETRVGGQRDRHAAHVTTPGAPELQATLRAMVLAGDQAVVLETTSHALELGRVAGIAYDAAVFTNLTHEHLELHGTFERYRAAKVRLFEMLANEADGPAAARWAKVVGGRAWPKAAVINLDDPSAPWFVQAAVAAGAQVIGYGEAATAAVRPTRVQEDAQRLRIAYDAPSGCAEISLRLAGRFNVHNALAVVALGEALGLDPAAVRGGLETVAGVPGRMERINAGQPFGVIVDYAHSPASLQTVLNLLAPVAEAEGGGLIAVFGSAGERDTAKRAVMGRVAGERCRLVIATDEDPRGEDREAIVAQIVGGAVAAGRRAGVDVLGIPDRRTAIAEAFRRARQGDLVLLAGKGHEASILYADHAIPWDEAAVARESLAAMGWGAGE
jgi:UDP-N-acetylmuramoyl-L-alanyl-D-glutamate--2,6-diaminopimelate ligase